VTVNVELTFMGKPVTFGEPFALSTGATLTLTTFRFYVSEPALVRGGESVPVDLVSAEGSPVPYNVHLVNPEDPAGMTFRLASPSGDYSGLSFLFGLSDSCNRSDPELSKPPLTTSSEMTWPPPFGYLFLRYEGALTGPSATAELPAQIDLGGMPGYLFAPRVTAAGSLRVAPSGGVVRLRVALEEIFRASNLPASQDSIGPTGPAFDAGNRLRQNVSRVSIFSLAAP
jgi:hypothetical protein